MTHREESIKNCKDCNGNPKTKKTKLENFDMVVCTKCLEVCSYVNVTKRINSYVPESTVKGKEKEKKKENNQINIF